MLLNLAARNKMGSPRAYGKTQFSDNGKTANPTI
jgi:hypothetical protein